MNRKKNNKTLVELDFDEKDVIEEFKNLEVKDYVYDLPDEKKPDEEWYKVFCKEIKSKGIYIKLKIKRAKYRVLFCMSFHVAEHKITMFPYS